MKKYLVPFLAWSLAVIPCHSAYGMKKASDRDLEDASNADSGSAQNSTVSRDENESETQSNIGRYSQDSQYSNESSTQPIMSQSSSQSREISPSNVHLFPRCEYYARFEGTSYFKMDEPKYWHTYHRSYGTRFFNSSKRKNTQYRDVNLSISPKGHNSYFSHTGGFFNPYSFYPHHNGNGYSDQIMQAVPIVELPSNLYNRILDYKNDLCRHVLENCPNLTLDNRPIVYHENDYPCIMVSIQKDQPEPWQNLWMGYFVGIVNCVAYREGIPIELVVRSSFGHNLPSVDVTDHSFRINIGIVPKAYARLLGKTLEALYNLSQIILTAKSHLDLPGDKKQSISAYNLSRLKEKIRENPLYKNLRDGIEEKDFKVLYQEFLAKNQSAQQKKGKSRFSPVEMKETCWESLSCSVNSNNGKIITGFFKESYYTDCFVDCVMNAVCKEGFFHSHLIAEQPIQNLFEYLSFSKHASVKTMISALKWINTKIDWKNNEDFLFKQEKEIEEDSNEVKFWDLIRDIFFST